MTVLEYKMVKETEKMESISWDIGRNESTLAGLRDLVELNPEMLDEAKEELEEKQQEAEKIKRVLDQIKGFVGMFKLFTPTIEEYAIAVENGGHIDAGNSFRGILYELGKLLERFKELIKEGLCWFPKLMRWKTSVGEVSPIFKDTDNG